jgi:cytochrome c oxidase subunit 3
MLSEHSPTLAHHFDSVEQQHQASYLGMWFFLVTEIMFFGGLFAGYAVYRRANAEAFAHASAHLDVWLGGFNTAVLIASSLTMALAVHAAQTGRRNRLVACLILTIALGSVFLGVKGIEYHHKYEEHLIPGADFQYAGAEAAGAEIFFSFYFAMTGMHAVHMIIGIGVLLILVLKSLKGRYSPAYFNPVEGTGLYWHFVDIVWIFLFPLLYLLGRH